MVVVKADDAIEAMLHLRFWGPKVNILQGVLNKILSCDLERENHLNKIELLVVSNQMLD